MRLDTHALGTFHEMAQTGADEAAQRLTGVAEARTRVGVTKVDFVRGDEIRADLAAGGEKIAVHVGLSGALEGHSMVVFDVPSALRVLQTLMPDRGAEGGSDPAATGSDADHAAAGPGDAVAGQFDELDRSAITEVGQMINGGFVDGWADVLEAAIDIDIPEFVRGNDAGPFVRAVDDPLRDDDMAITFRSRIEAVDTAIAFDHYLFPKHESFGALLDRLRDGDGIEYDKLVGFDRLAQRGAREVADNITTMTGFDTTVELRRLHFVPMAAIPQEVGDEHVKAVAFEFEGTPSGYLVFLFDQESAATVVDGMLPSGPADPDGELGRSAVQELSNIMASGFLDGWANVLDTYVDHTPPEYSEGPGAAVLDPIVLQFGDEQEYGFVFDTRVRAADREFDVEIYAIPHAREFERALDQLDVERVDDEPIEADFPIEEA